MIFNRNGAYFVYKIDLQLRVKICHRSIKIVNKFVRFDVGGNLAVSLDPSVVRFKIGKIIQEPGNQFGLNVEQLVHEEINISYLFKN